MYFYSAVFDDYEAFFIAATSFEHAQQLALRRVPDSSTDDWEINQVAFDAYHSNGSIVSVHVEG